MAKPRHPSDQKYPERSGHPWRTERISRTARTLAPVSSTQAAGGLRRRIGVIHRQIQRGNLNGHLASTHRLGKFIPAIQLNYSFSTRIYELAKISLKNHY